MSLNFANGEKVLPGQTLGKVSASIVPGEGVIIRGNKYFCVLKGAAHLGPVDDSGTQVVSVKRDAQKTAGIHLGDTVLARVSKIKQDTVFVHIVCVNGFPISIELEGVIKRRDVREKEVDKIKMQECFIPGDIVKATVASYGDSRRIQLKTHEDQHGVVFARAEDTGVLMFPVSPTEMMCPLTREKEKRKVAIPNFDDYATREEEEEN